MTDSGLLRSMSALMPTPTEPLEIRKKASNALQELLANPLESIYTTTKVDSTKYI
jgi:hypothetical protein